MLVLDELALEKQKYGHMQEQDISGESSTRYCTTLLSQTNDTAGVSTTGVASLGRLVVAALSEVVGAGVDDDGSTDDGLGSDQLEVSIGDGAFGDTVGVSLDVAEITCVSLVACVRTTVLLTQRVEVRAGRRATVRVVAKLVDVEATLGRGVVAGDVVVDCHWRRLVRLRKLDRARHLGIAAEDCDCIGSLIPALSCA